MRLKKRLLGLFKKENKLLHKDLLDFKFFLMLLVHDEKLAKIKDPEKLFNHRYKILEELFKEESLYNKLAHVLKVIETYTKSFQSEKHQILIREVNSYLDQLRKLDAKRGSLDRLFQEIKVLVEEYQNGDTSKQNQLVTKMDQAISIVKTSFVDIEKLIGLINELLIIDIGLAEQMDKTTLDYLYDSVTQMYHAEQAIRISGDGGINGIIGFYFGTILGGLSGEYKSMDMEHVDHYNQVRLTKLLQIHPLSTIRNRKILNRIFFIIQHMDKNPALQRRLFEQFKRNPHARPRDVAYLTDRILKNSRQPIWFGTQNDYPVEVFAIKCIQGAKVLNILRDEKGNEYGELTEASIQMVSARLHAYGLPSIDEQYQYTIKKNNIKKLKKTIGRALMFINPILRGGV